LRENAQELRPAPAVAVVQSNPAIWSRAGHRRLRHCQCASTSKSAPVTVAGQAIISSRDEAQLRHGRSSSPSHPARDRRRGGQPGASPRYLVRSKRQPQSFCCRRHRACSIGTMLGLLNHRKPIAPGRNAPSRAIRSSSQRTRRCQLSSSSSSASDLPIMIRFHRPFF
jgi:hypothetical protein